MPNGGESGTALDEMKTHQRGPRAVLRSKSPGGVRQEAYGYLCTHYAIRTLMADAASDHGIDPDRISFTRALNAARRSIRAGLGASSGTLATALPATISEICRQLLPLRRLRAAPRAVKRKMSNYAAKRTAHRSWPQPARPPASAIRVLASPQIMSIGANRALNDGACTRHFRSCERQARPVARYGRVWPRAAVP